MKIIVFKVESDSNKLSTKKSWEPNWEHQEVMTLIQAKWKEYIARLNMVDLKYWFKDVKCKWQKIVDFENASGTQIMMHVRAIRV
jgi:hypothetical protein